MNAKSAFLTALLGSALFAALPALAADLPKGAGVSFVTPADGATVSSPVTVKFGLAGLSIKPAGDMSPGTGHHHLLVDQGPVPEGQVIPADAQHLHFGKGQTETTLTLPPGEHTLTLQFANGAHQSYGPALSQSITITVK